MFNLYGEEWFSRGVASIKLVTFEEKGFLDAALICDNKTEEKHFSYLLRNKIVAKGNNSWVLHQTYDMSGKFQTEIVALQFFSEQGAQNFKQSFDKCFPERKKKKRGVVPDLPGEHDIYKISLAASSRMKSDDRKEIGMIAPSKVMSDKRISVTQYSQGFYFSAYLENEKYQHFFILFTHSVMLIL